MNLGQFRAVRDISVAPINASDQAQIIRMMDDEDGVLIVRKRKFGGAGGTGSALATAKKNKPDLTPLLDNENEDEEKDK